MSRPQDSVNENTSNLGRGRQHQHEVHDDAPEPVATKTADTDPRRRIPCADPDPTEGVARRARETTAAHVAATDPPAPVVAEPPPAAPVEGDSASAPNAVSAPHGTEEGPPGIRHDLPVVVDATLHSVRRYVAGDVIADRFVIVDRLPGSGMGQVYKALDRHRDATEAPSSYVAIKFGQSPADAGSASASTVRHEYEILSRLSHPNIVKAFEIGSHDDAEFLVMEWLDGRSLLHELDKQTCKRMALSRARHIIHDVAAGLACAHSRGIVHGDVKPSNIFITRHGTVKLLDFGAVSASGDEAEWQSWATRAYASVDVLDGKPARPRDDVYSLGVTAYLLLSGERPFGTRDAAEAHGANLRVQALPQDAADLWPAVQAALSFDAATRPADAARFLAEFLPLPQTDTAPEKPPFDSYWPYAAVAALVLAMTALWVLRLDDLSGLDTRATLRAAQLAIAEGRLTEPDGDSALSYFRAVLAEAPENPAARQGIDEIAEDFLIRAANSLAINDFEAARSNLASARRVSPDHSSIPIVNKLFDRYASDLVVSAGLIAGRNPTEAKLMLEQAEQLTDSESVRIAEIRARMADAAIDLELRTLYAGIDERILAERLAVPPGDSAIDLLNRARDIRPDDERLALAENRIVSALLFQALFAISEGKLDRADEYIAAAKSLDVRHLATARTVYELAKARDRVASRVYELAISGGLQDDAVSDTAADANSAED